MGKERNLLQILGDISTPSGVGSQSFSGHRSMGRNHVKAPCLKDQNSSEQQCHRQWVQMDMLNSNPECGHIVTRLRDEFVRYSTRCVFPSNGVVYLQEDKAEKFFIVISGYIRLSYIMKDGTGILYAIVPPGQSFGELGVFDGSVYADTASAVGPASVLAVRSEVFHSSVPQGTEMRAALSALIAERYKAYIEVTKCLYLSSLTARLAVSLLRLVKSLGQTAEFEGRSCFFLGSMVTQSDLGAMARGTRGNVNRVLKKWERDGLVILRDRKIVIWNMRQFEILARKALSEDE